MISLLGTHPNHERKGAASQLIKWGCEKADRAQLPCYVDSSPTARALYTRFGFEVVGELDVDLDQFEGGQGCGLQRWYVMRREPVCASK